MAKPSPQKRERALRIAAVLEECIGEPAVPLDHRDPFTLLVAVALSAQTTDAAVNRVTPALFDAAPNPAAMVALGPEAVLQHIKTLGLAPTKAKNLVRMAAQLMESHAGLVPADFAALEALPGVGHKTASVVMAQAFGIPAFPVDTHIHRCAERWGLSDGSNVARTEADLKALFPEALWNRLHLQIILFARAHCPARGHDPLVCPVCSFTAKPRPAKRVSKKAPVSKARPKA